MADLMNNLGEALLDKIVGSATVLVGQSVDAIAGLLRSPYATQLRAIHGLKSVLDGVSRVALLNGDTGSGKTMMGLALVFLWFSSRLGLMKLAGKIFGGLNVVVCAPPTLCIKWEREIRATIPSVQVTQCVGRSATSTLRKGLEEPKNGIRFFIVADTTIRRHFHSEKPSLTTNSPRLNAKLDEIAIKSHLCRNREGDVLARCPRCGQLFRKEHSEGEYTYKTVEQMARKSSIRCTHIDPHTKKECGEIWRAPVTTSVKTVEIEVDGEMEEETLSNPHLMAREVSLAYWAKKYARKQGLIDLVIVDEVHRAKSDGAHGEATRWLVNAGKRALLLTGTLTGGYARDLFYLLYMINPAGMRKLGYRYCDEGRFCDAYGASETKRWFEKVKTSVGNDKKKSSSRHRPGISSNVFPDLLVDRTVFVALDELEIEMPEKREFLEVVPLDEKMREMYDFVSATFTKELAHMVKAAGMSTSISSLVSKSIAVRASWADRLQADTIDGMVENGKGTKIPVSIPIFDYEPGGPTNKEARMIEIIKQNKAVGRKVLVYVTFTDKRDCAARMAKIFGEAGINAVVLGKQVSATKREQWIYDQVASGVDVVITNPERVKEGYDLIMFPTIIMAQPTLNLFTHRQSMARAYRPGQKQEVHHYFLAYENTIQENLLVLAASKLDSALLAEGNLQESALLDVSESQDSIMRELIMAVISGNEQLLKLPKATINPVAMPVLAPVVAISPEEETWSPITVKVLTRVTEVFRHKLKVAPVAPVEQLTLFDFTN